MIGDGHLSEGELTAVSGPWAAHEKLLIVAVVLSGLLFVIGATGAEVYPAPTLPSFGGIPEPTNQAVTEWNVELRTIDGDLHKLSIRDIFTQAPSSQFNNLISGVVNNQNDPAVSTWFANQIEQRLSACATEIVLHRGGHNSERLTFDGSCS